MLALSIIQQQNAHVPIVTNTGKACAATVAQILYFVWLLHVHAGDLCKRYPLFFPCAPTRLATITQPAGFLFVQLKKKKYCHSWKKQKYLMSACASDRGEETWGRRGDIGGGQQLWHYVAWKIFSCLIHETQSPPRVTMVATFSHLCITLYYVLCVCVRWRMIDSLTNHLPVYCMP